MQFGYSLGEKKKSTKNSWASWRKQIQERGAEAERRNCTTEKGNRENSSNMGKEVCHSTTEVHIEGLSDWS